MLDWVASTAICYVCILTLAIWPACPIWESRLGGSNRGFSILRRCPWRKANDFTCRGIEHLKMRGGCLWLAIDDMGKLGCHRLCPLDLDNVHLWDCRMNSAHRSAIMMVGALVLPLIKLGITEASQTRKPVMPCSRSCGSTTASGSLPILQVPEG